MSIVHMDFPFYFFTIKHPETLSKFIGLLNSLARIATFLLPLPIKNYVLDQIDFNLQLFLCHDVVC